MIRDYCIRAVHKRETSFISWNGMGNNHTRPIGRLTTTLKEDTHRKQKLCDIEEESQLQFVKQG